MRRDDAAVLEVLAVLVLAFLVAAAAVVVTAPKAPKEGCCVPGFPGTAAATGADGTYRGEILSQSTAAFPYTDLVRLLNGTLIHAEDVCGLAYYGSGGESSFTYYPLGAGWVNSGAGCP